MNWSCSSPKYFQSENKPPFKPLCRFHSGKYDFGHTGMTIAETIGEWNKEKSEKIWWKPHWTCCRGNWRDRGCSIGYH